MFRNVANDFKGQIALLGSFLSATKLSKCSSTFANSDTFLNFAHCDVMCGKTKKQNKTKKYKYVCAYLCVIF